MPSIDWDKYSDVGGGSGDKVDAYWPDREHPLKAGDEIAGKITNKYPKKGDRSAYYILETEEGNTLVWGSTVLDRKLEAVNLGDDIAIRFLGQKNNEKTGRKYKDFKVGVTNPIS